MFFVRAALEKDITIKIDILNFRDALDVTTFLPPPSGSSDGSLDFRVDTRIARRNSSRSRAFKSANTRERHARTR